MISVVIPCLNSEKKLRSTLVSLIKQNCRTFEIILADGGSTDQSISVFNKEIKNKNIISKILVNQKEKNISETLYQAFRIAKGDFIYQICAGDYLVDSDWLGIANRALSRKNNLDAVWARTLLLTCDKRPCKIFPPLAFREIPAEKKFPFFWLQYGISPPDNTIVVRRQLLLKYFNDGKNEQHKFENQNPHAYFNYEFCKNGFYLYFFDRIVHNCVVESDSRTQKNFFLNLESEKLIRNKKRKHFIKCIFKNKIMEQGKMKQLNLQSAFHLYASFVISFFPLYKLFQYSIPEIFSLFKKMLLKKTNYWD